MAASDSRWPPLKDTAWRVTFPALDADGDLVPDISDMDTEISKDGAAFGDCVNEAVEIAASSGMYYLDVTDSEMDADCVAIIFKSEYCKTTPIVVYPVSGGFNEAVTDHDKTQSDVALLDPLITVASDLAASASVLITGAAAAGTLSTTQMTTDLTEVTNDHYNGRVVIWTSGVLLGQATDITDYTGANGLLTYTAVTEAPGDGDTFVIV